MGFNMSTQGNALGSQLLLSFIAVVRFLLGTMEISRYITSRSIDLIVTLENLLEVKPRSNACHLEFDRIMVGMTLRILDAELAHQQRGSVK